MSTKLIFLLIILVSSFNISYASRVDENYIQTYKNRLILSFLIAQPNLGLKISRKQNNITNEINYLPNTKVSTGIGFSYWWLGGSVSWRGSESNLDESIYGKSKYIDYQINYYSRWFGIDANYQEYKHYYLDNPGQFYSSWSQGEPYPQRPDLKMTVYGANFYYIFSHSRFSFRAAFNQTERQKKMAGSFLLMTSISYLDISSDYSLIPADKEADFGDLSGFKGGKFIAFSIAPGYVYTFVWWKLYITPSIFLGPGFQHQVYEVATGEKTTDKAGLKGNIRLAFGYNGDRFFIGYSLISDVTTITQGDVSIQSTTTNGKLFVGYKF